MTGVCGLLPEYEEGDGDAKEEEEKAEGIVCLALCDASMASWS